MSLKMRCYQHELDTLVGHGLRFEHQCVEEELLVLRWQLDLNKQLPTAALGGIIDCKYAMRSINIDLPSPGLSPR